MTKRLIIPAALIYTVATILLSILLIQPAKPIIDIKGEKLVTIYQASNEMLTVAITNTMLTAWIVAALLVVICWVAVRKKALIPSGFYNLFEALIEGIDNLITGIVGPENGRRFFPLIATFFLFIGFANWFSLMPVFNTFGIFEPVHAEKNEFHDRAVAFHSGGVSLILPGAKDFAIDAKDCETISDEDQATACREKAIEAATGGKVKSNEKIGVLAPYLRGINTDLMTPLAFALVSVFLVQYWGIQSLGFRRYMSKFVNFSSPINFFVGFLETIAEIAKIISFSFRLFGNLLAGEILLLVMTFLVAVCSPVLVVFYGLELFVGAIQAFVFGTLTLVFASLAVSGHGGEEHAEEGQHH